MHAWAGGRRLDRDDRHVRRSRVRLNDRTAAHRVRQSLVEALRLTRLPGEDQGRVYYFRHVSLRGVPADGSREIWLDAMQRVLAALAQTAVHGVAAGAEAAGAVFFSSHEEALALLFGRLVHHRPCAAWFWTMVSDAGAASRREEQLVAVIERLRDLPAAWTRVALVVFAALEPEAVADLGAALPAVAARRWLRELGDGGAGDGGITGVAFPDHAARALRGAVRRLGRDDPRTVWLGSLAVILAAPPSFAAGTAVARARAALRRLDAGNRADPVNDSRTPAEIQLRAAPIAFDDRDGVVEDARDPSEAATFQDDDAQALARSPDSAADPRSADAHRSDLRATPADSAAPGAQPSPPSRPPDAPAGDALRERAFRNDGDDLDACGARTAAAGLLFLLNALTRLGIAQALESDPALAEAGFVPRILARLATHAGVDAADPMLPWIALDIARSADAFALLRPGAAAWPRMLIPSRRNDPDGEYIVRAWSVAVHRYCRRVGRLTVRDVVNRTGSVALTRTDIDVSLPLGAADIRIRRIGLDIDPGWLPWLGRVVRFHYTRAEP